MKNNREPNLRLQINIKKNKNEHITYNIGRKKKVISRSTTTTLLVAAAGLLEEYLKMLRGSLKLTFNFY